MCSTSFITMPSLVGLGFQAPPGRTKMLSFCLSVCSSRCWTSEFVRPISPWMRWSTETISMPLNRGICVHPCSTLKVSKNVSVSALQGLGLGLVSWQKSHVSVSWNCRKALVSVSSWIKNRMSRSRKLRSRLHPWQAQTQRGHNSITAWLLVMQLG